MAAFRVQSVLVAAAFAAAMGACVPAVASAQDCAFCGITPGESSARTGPAPIELHLETTLNFDRVILDGSGAGLVMLKPDGASQVSGAVESLGGKTMVGRLVIRGEPGRAILVDFPATLELISINGGTLSVESVVTDLPPSPALDPSGQLVVNFGGELKISGDVDGDFRGNLLIRADYL